MKIRCTTLFDITRTDVSSRRHQLGDGFLKLDKERQQQSNFETLLQIIGLRSQPEDVERPVVTTTKRAQWGQQYRSKSYKTWTFTFTVNASSVFKHDGDDLGYLKMDCTGVPMITGLDETPGLPVQTLESSGTGKNINFEVVDDA